MDVGFTPEELAEKFRQSKSKVYALLKKGRIGHYRLGGAIFVTQADIDAYLASCRVEPAEAQKKEPPQARWKHLTL